MPRNWFILTIGAFTLAATLGSNGRAEDGATLRSKYVRVEGVLNPLAVERECDAIVARLVERYGVPRRWKTFPVRFRRPNGGPVAGYTAYARPDVAEIVLYMTFEESRGGALDHELTHAFFFYYLDDYFDLLFNEGVAQNSETANRARLRGEVYRRFARGETTSLARLYGRNEYDPELLLYVQGFSVVDYLIGRGGSRWFAAFLDELTNGNVGLDDALRRFYDCESLDALEREWREYVRNGQDRLGTRAVK